MFEQLTDASLRPFFFNLIPHLRNLEKLITDQPTDGKLNYINLYFPCRSKMQERKIRGTSTWSRGKLYLHKEKRCN